MQPGSSYPPSGHLKGGLPRLQFEANDVAADGQEDSLYFSFFNIVESATPIPDGCHSASGVQVPCPVPPRVQPFKSNPSRTSRGPPPLQNIWGGVPPSLNPGGPHLQAAVGVPESVATPLPVPPLGSLLLPDPVECRRHVPFHDDASLLFHLLQPGGFADWIQNDFGIDIRASLQRTLDPSYDTKYGFPNRMRECLAFWQHVLCAPEDMLLEIAEGVKLEFVASEEEVQPCDFSFKCSRYSADEKVTGRAIITQLLSMQVLEVCDGPGHNTLSVFFVPKDLTHPDVMKRFRFIFDGHFHKVNLAEKPFKMDKLYEFAGLLKEGDQVAGFDLRDGYYHVSVHSEFRKYICLAFPKEDGSLGYYRFAALPQGLGSSGFNFDHRMGPVWQFLRQQLKRPVFAYLDDGRPVLGHISDSDVVILNNATVVFGTLAASGTAISWSKSFPAPVLSFPITGYEISTLRTVRLALTDKRWAKLRDLCGVLLAAEAVSAREWARIGGGIQSGYLVFDNARLHLRGIYDLLMACLEHGWDTRCSFSRLEVAVAELQYWLAILQGPKTVITVTSQVPIFFPVDVEMKSDAGAAVIGGLCRLPLITEPDVAAALSEYSLGKGKFGFSQCETESARIRAAEQRTSTNLLTEHYEKSSTWRELLAVLHNILTFEPRITGKAVRLFVDNAAVVQIFRFGSRRPDCHRLMIAIDKELQRMQTRLFPMWVPRHCNADADATTHVDDFHDYRLAPLTLSALAGAFDCFPTVDLFADHTNKQPCCTSFVSRFFQPGCATVDALSLDWRALGQSAVVFAPVHAMYRVCSLLWRVRDWEGIVVVPLWRNQQYMSLLFPDNCHFVHQVKAYQFLQRGWDIVQGPVGRPYFLQQPFSGHKFMFVAILWRSDDFVPVDGRVRRPPVSRFQHAFCLNKHFSAACSACGWQ